MSKFNTTIQNNNTDLQEILNTINALPEAGSGTSENLDDVLGDQDNIITQLEQAIAGKAIGGGGIDTSDATATENDILLNKTAYVNGQKITGKIDTAKQAVPTLSINSSTGLITANVTQMRGYIPSDGTTTKTMQLAFAPAKTITPGTSSQIAVSSGYYTGGNITVAGDANLVAGNIKKGTSIFGVNGNYEGSGGTADTSMEDALIGGSLTTYINDRVTALNSYAFIGNTALINASFPNCVQIKDGIRDFMNPEASFTGAFGYCSNLVSVSFPVCSYIGSYAFYSCLSLSSINFSVCSYIGSEAFVNCVNLTSASFPVCSYIGSYAFLNCVRLSLINFPVCSHIGSYAFQACINLASANFSVCSYIGMGAFYTCFSLTSVNFPACSYIGGWAFSDCTSLTSVNFPACSYIGGSAFCNCSRLTSVNFPVCSYIGSDAFYGCSSLTLADFGGNSTVSKCTIYSYAFAYCKSLTNLTLYYSFVVTLSNTNAFANTPLSISTLTGSFGSIYVPASLVNAYKSATNWATYASRITAIVEEPTLINFTIDGISYQAEEGMTWLQWTESEYNIDNYQVSNNSQVTNVSGRKSVANPTTYDPVIPADIIISISYGAVEFMP